MTGEIGEMFEMSRNVNFEWKIPNFLSLLGNTYSCYCSPEIPLSDSCWYLQICFGSDIDCKFRLLRVDFGPPKAITWKLGIRKVNGNEEVLQQKQILDASTSADKKSCQGICLKGNDLLKRQLELIPWGALTVTCTLSSYAQHSVKVSLFQRLWNLSCSLRDSLYGDKNADVTVKLKGREIPAHRVMLESRSEVFKRMLASGMRESTTGVIDLVEEAEEPFSVVLYYMYCGDLKGLDSNKVCAVYKIAHKFDLQDLRKFCCTFIENNMSVDLMCDVIAMSHLYEEAELKKYAKGYFEDNVAEILKTEKWKSFRS